MSTPTADRGSRRTTGQRAKDSGGGMISMVSAIREVMDTLVAMGMWRDGRTSSERAHARWTRTREYRRAYARQWNLEGPHA